MVLVLQHFRVVFCMTVLLQGSSRSRSGSQRSTPISEFLDMDRFALAPIVQVGTTRSVVPCRAGVVRFGATRRARPYIPQPCALFSDLSPSGNSGRYSTIERDAE
jgi:hypothetical protein